MLHILLLAGAIVCAVLAIRAQRLLVSALWLAGSSALVALLLYLLGAPEIAVVELSVGAGLVTVLFVFAINIAGEEALPERPILPRPVSWGLILISVALLSALNLARPTADLPAGAITAFTTTLWEQRGLDVLVQIALIFSGVLGVLGLLAESRRAGHSEAQA